MNENEIKMKGRTKSARFKKFQVFDQKMMIQSIDYEKIT
jgi:hypothetical protein